MSKGLPWLASRHLWGSGLGRQRLAVCCDEPRRLYLRARQRWTVFSFQVDRLRDLSNALQIAARARDRPPWVWVPPRPQPLAASGKAPCGMHAHHLIKRNRTTTPRASWTSSDIRLSGYLLSFDGVVCLSCRHRATCSVGSPARIATPRIPHGRPGRDRAQCRLLVTTARPGTSTLLPLGVLYSTHVDAPPSIHPPVNRSQRAVVA